MGISFNYINTASLPLKKRKIISWIKNNIEIRQGKLGDINYIFSDDKYILEINQNYLKHDYYTDIISFDYSEFNYSSQEIKVSGDLFISLDTVLSNSLDLGIEFYNELYRVMIHGVLHLLGYKDETEEEKMEMRKQEEECLRNMIL